MDAMALAFRFLREIEEQGLSIREARKVPGNLERLINKRLAEVEAKSAFTDWPDPQPESSQGVSPERLQEASCDQRG